MADFFLGCDVSKGYADFIIMDHQKQVIEQVFQLDDTFDGHKRLYDILNNLFKSYPDTCLNAAVESTGGLENNWLNMLYRLHGNLPVHAARINPIGPNALHKASLERNGSDAISARKIAEYLIAYPEKISYNAEDPYVALRKQYNLVELFKKQKTQLLNQLSILLYASMPFLLHYCKQGIPNWVLQLVAKYPSAQKLDRTQLSTLSAIPYISQKRAGTLLNVAKQSIGSATDETMALVIKTTVEQIIHLKNTIEKHKRHMIKHCDLPEVRLLESFPGIGRYSAIGLLLNIVSIERFPKAKHLASYFGIHPVYKQSGDGSGAYRMSKKGRSVPRQILFMAARTAIIHNPLIKDIYIQHIKTGKSKMAAIGVCMHKILRIVFGILKHNKGFDPEVDKRNKIKSIQINNPEKERKKRRFQPNTEYAPISRRQDKKRKGKQSQSGTSGVLGINVSPSIV